MGCKDGSEPADCPVDPCINTCPGAVSCRPDICGGTCTAMYFGADGNVIDNCAFVQDDSSIAKTGPPPADAATTDEAPTDTAATTDAATTDEPMTDTAPTDIAVVESTTGSGGASVFKNFMIAPVTASILVASYLFLTI